MYSLRIFRCLRRHNSLITKLAALLCGLWFLVTLLIFSEGKWLYHLNIRSYNTIKHDISEQSQLKYIAKKVTDDTTMDIVRQIIQKEIGLDESDEEDDDTFIREILDSMKKSDNIDEINDNHIKRQESGDVSFINESKNNSYATILSFSESTHNKSYDVDNKSKLQYSTHGNIHDVNVNMTNTNKSGEIFVDLDYPGKLGQPVWLNVSQLNATDKARYHQGWERHSFNELVSAKIPLRRGLPDYRDPKCRDMQNYSSVLPDTSVIICFHNEAWSTLLRTVHSVLDRSPTRLIREIILVDDFSDSEHLTKPLEMYISQLKKVKIIRTLERLGLIQARLLGYSVAQGDVLTFLDSHCECTEGMCVLDEACQHLSIQAPLNRLLFNNQHLITRIGKKIGWLEPLLSRVAENRTNVVCPIITVINSTNFEMKTPNPKHSAMGVFHWDGLFNWESVPEEEHKRRNFSYHLPHRSPVMAGGLFSISRVYFTELGTYDKEMIVWGGENLELSFRIWMCGGNLEIVPCSIVGHVFRHKNPNVMPGVNAHRFNTVRMAEVWMDEYRNYYYETFNYTNLNPSFYGNLTDRKALRVRLKCHNFGWYLANVYAGTYDPSQAQARGDIRNMRTSNCIESAPFSHDAEVYVSTCRYNGGGQGELYNGHRKDWIRVVLLTLALYHYFYPILDINYANEAIHGLADTDSATHSTYWVLTKEGQIRRNNGCLETTADARVRQRHCRENNLDQIWTYTPLNTLYQNSSATCITLSGTSIVVSACNSSDSQIWWLRTTIIPAVG